MSAPVGKSLNKMANSSLEEVHSKVEAEEGIEESQGFMDFQDTIEFQRRGLGKEELIGMESGSVLDEHEEEVTTAANIETKEGQDLVEEGSLSLSKVEKEAKECQFQDELIGGDEQAKTQVEAEIQEENVHSYEDPDKLSSFQFNSNYNLGSESMTKASQQEEKLDASSGKRKHTINEEASGKRAKVSEE